jgi:hypothetical protein
MNNFRFKKKTIECDIIKNTYCLNKKISIPTDEYYKNYVKFLFFFLLTNGY